MAGMTDAEIIKLVEGLIGVNAEGYLNGFTYAKHESFYSLYCGLDIDVVAARSRFGSTKKTFAGILKELRPQDQAKVIRGTIKWLAETGPHGENGHVDSETAEKLIDVARRLESGSVVVDGLFESSKTVFLALKDAEMLIDKHGPDSAVDRAHTALHGYLKNLCNRKGLATSPTASVPDLFGQLRKEVPELKNAVAHDELAKRLLGSISTALECINTIRNRGTLAHPNEMLLEGPEAMLFINCSRSVLAYLDAKLPEDAA